MASVREWALTVAEVAARRAGLPFGDSKLCASIVEAIEDNWAQRPDVAAMHPSAMREFEAQRKEAIKRFEGAD